ncbi:MAG TPA: hypothetical protein VFB60_19045 [Ktedonobacteraceae bacterium]|nr:hypothetical protein [Ktedonobacteraceae bacterium]
MGNAEMKPEPYSDITVLHWLQILDYSFREISYERVFIQAIEDYRWAELIFHQVEYMSCPTYLGGNYRWRLALPKEAEKVFEMYIMSDADRERARDECTVYCVDESLNVYNPRPQRTPYTFYLVAHRVEILLYWGENLVTVAQLTAQGQ